MSATVTTANPFQPPRSGHLLRRRISNVLTIVLCVLAALFAIILLFYLLIYIIWQGIPNLNLDFFTQLPAAFGSAGGGMGEAIQGTLILIGLASVIGIPLGLFMGIYLAEFGNGPLGNAIRFMVSVLTGIPTIIFGLFIWILIVIPQQGYSALAGGAAFGIVMIPIVATTSEDVLKLVPNEIREASLALGATEARTTLLVIVPAAINGIITGIVLAMARVAGETAPLLMTAFGNTFWNTDITQPIDALPYRIFVFTTSPYQLQLNQAFTGSLILVTIIFLTSFLVRWVTGGFKRKF